MAKNNEKNPEKFEDYFGIMEEKLGGEELIGEICKGFELLKDVEKGVITFENLREMLNEGDYDGDGVLNQMEFCVLMFRLSPHLMDRAHDLLHHQLDRFLY
ncbi:hypothetical protein RND81_01G085500 [Saponaria officinalis]|uniref:EF-hand domain-containing protein n=1 Tax=Saponaria officinalis TaxID=3572 RepID=A0AAW1NFD0_SAPOF